MEATLMKLLTVFGTAALAILLGISAPVYAQDESHPQEEKRAEPEDKAAHEQDKQEDKQVEKDKEEKKEVDRDKDTKQSEQQEEKSAHQEDRTQADHHEAKEGGRIPEDRFRANFGRAHTFSIGHPVIVSGTPRFQYGGYWFVIAQPWPVGWAYTDVVYVDFIGGGYYLLSPVHPGIQISINVIL
jgi:hypothetical protein